MSDSKDEKPQGGRGVGFWITVIRGILLIVLGLSLLLIPEKTHKMLFNAMGLFWLTAGLAVVRREANREGNRLLLAAGAAGVLAGVLAVTRDLSRMWLAEAWVKGLLGGIILLTGVLHVATQFVYGRQIIHGRPLVNLLLGIAEIVLGALLLLFPADGNQFLYSAAIVWALLVGGLILFTSARQWFQERRQVQAGPAEEQDEEQTKDQT